MLSEETSSFPTNPTGLFFKCLLFTSLKFPRMGSSDWHSQILKTTLESIKEKFCLSSLSFFFTLRGLSQRIHPQWYLTSRHLHIVGHPSTLDFPKGVYTSSNVFIHFLVLPTQHLFFATVWNISMSLSDDWPEFCSSRTIHEEFVSEGEDTKVEEKWEDDEEEKEVEMFSLRTASSVFVVTQLSSWS